MFGEEADEAVPGDHEESVRVDDVTKVRRQEEVETRRQVDEAVARRDVHEREQGQDGDVPAAQWENEGQWRRFGIACFTDSRAESLVECTGHPKRL